MFQPKLCRENQKTRFMFNNFFSKNCVFYKIMWKKCVRTRQTTDDNIIRRMRFVYRITKATDTHSDYVIRIPFPLQECLGERASMLRYTKIVCLHKC
jgi:hypothetical protein